MGTWNNNEVVSGLMIIVVVVVNLMMVSLEVKAQTQRVPALFVFGDSLVDVGNNNLLNTLAKSNYFPYGIDFRGGPTGRFSNGFNIADFIGNLLGVPQAAAFANPTTRGPTILNGVNFASGAAGILQETGRHYGDRFSLNQQGLNFENTLNQLRTMMNGTALSQYLAKSIAILVFGSNDYINNYLLPTLYNSSYLYNPQQFGNLLLNSYARQIQALYSLGLRKFFLAGVGPLGCIPNQRASAPPGRCADGVNQMLGTFNEGLRAMVDQLNKNHPDAMFVYGNTYAVFGDILNNPAAYCMKSVKGQSNRECAFSVIDRGCCGMGRNQGQITCLPFQVPCPNRSQYVFWDAFHPTQSAAYVFSWRAVNGPPSDSYPINIQQMALL